MRRYYPWSYLQASCGENQKTSAIRMQSWRYGYRKGSPDIEIKELNRVREGGRVVEYSGVVIDFKNPGQTGTLNDAQRGALDKHRLRGYKAVVIDDYDEATRTISNYLDIVRYRCKGCMQLFKTTVTPGSHMRWICRSVRPLGGYGGY